MMKVLELVKRSNETFNKEGLTLFPEKTFQDNPSTL